MIHPTAIVHPKAKLDSTVQVGPYALIDEGVEVGPHCAIGPHVYLTGGTTIGAHNRFHAGCVIGDAPQDLKYQDAPTRLRIGDHNVFREYVTAHRSNRPGEETLVGSHGFFMANAHVGHNAQLGDYVILANGAALGGHVVVGDRAFVSANTVVHQFVRMGMLSLMQGGAALTQDLPPFTMATKVNELCGLNIVGLRRAGFSAEERLELKQVYRLLFREGRNLRSAISAAQSKFNGPAAKVMLDFVATTKRGVCGYPRGHRQAAPEEDREAGP